MRLARGCLVLLAFLLLASPVLAHVPDFPSDNTTPERAVEVPEPVKSWAFYDSLGDGDVKYYRVELQAGDPFHVGTFTPQSRNFTASIVVMSQALETTDPVPPGVTLPADMGATVVQGDRPRTPSYEPFTPSANYHTASFDQQVDSERTSLIAVYEPANRTGPVGVTIGTREEWTPAEFLSIPFDRVRVHRWEGQHPLLVIGPFLLIVLAGVGLVRRRWQEEWEQIPIRIALVVAGLVTVGSGVNTAVQLALALTKTGLTVGALLTTAFVLVPIVGGSWVLGLCRRPACRLTLPTRVGLAVTGIFTLLTWAGFLLGPGILIGLALIPSRLLPE
jgi:hypothetical protein